MFAVLWYMMLCLLCFGVFLFCCCGLGCFVVFVCWCCVLLLLFWCCDVHVFCLLFRFVAVSMFGLVLVLFLFVWCVWFVVFCWVCVRVLFWFVLLGVSFLLFFGGRGLFLCLCLIWCVCV